MKTLTVKKSYLVPALGKMVGYDAEFTINRAYWKHSGLPTLITSFSEGITGSMDIFGSLALALGIPAKYLIGISSLELLPDEIIFHYPVLDKLLAPSLTGEVTLSPFARVLLTINYSTASLAEKEDSIQFLLLSNGIFPHFRG